MASSHVTRSISPECHIFFHISSDICNSYFRMDITNVKRCNIVCFAPIITPRRRNLAQVQLFWILKSHWEILFWRKEHSQLIGRKHSLKINVHLQRKISKKIQAVKVYFGLQPKFGRPFAMISTKTRIAWPENLSQLSMPPNLRRYYVFPKKINIAYQPVLAVERRSVF